MSSSFKSDYESYQPLSKEGLLYLNKMLQRDIERLEHQNESLRKQLEVRQYGPDSGCVYILRARSGEYKIGKTYNLPNRITQLQHGLPFRLEFILAIVTDNRHKLEKELHERFASKRVKDEWFVITRWDIQAIRKEYEYSIVEL